MPNNVTQFSGGWYGVPSATASSSVALTDGVLAPSTLMNKSVSQNTITIAGIDTTAPGVKFTHQYTLRCGYQLTSAFQVRLRTKFGTPAASPAGATGRINIDLRRRDVTGNISSIPGVTKGYGVPRGLNQVGSTFVDNHIVATLPNQQFLPGESLVILVEFEVLATAAGNSLSVAFYNNPATVGDEFMVEIDVGKP